jgi:hypothetical protein
MSARKWSILLTLLIRHRRSCLTKDPCGKREEVACVGSLFFLFAELLYNRLKTTGSARDNLNNLNETGLRNHSNLLTATCVPLYLYLALQCPLSCGVWQEITSFHPILHQHSNSD